MLLERWLDCWIVYWGCLFVYFNCIVIFFEFDIICVFYGGIWILVLIVKVSYICGVVWKLNKLVKYFLVLYGNYVFVKYVRLLM